MNRAFRPVVQAARAHGATARHASSASATKPAVKAAPASRSRFVSGLSATQQKLVYDLASERQTSVSLLQLYKFGLLAAKEDDDQQETLIQAAHFLHKELPIRMSHRIVELEHLPDNLSESPAVQKVAKWYADSVEQMMEHPDITDPETEQSLTRLITSIYGRHSATLVTMARGIAEFKHSKGVGTTMPLPEELETAVQRFLDGFYSSRIGIRTLIEQHIALHNPQEGHVGIINTHSNPVEICRGAVADAQIMCERELGDAPEATIYGDDAFTFNYIDSHIHHIVFELVKNAMRAVIERHGDDSPPPIRVIVAAGSQHEDVVIKVSDEGGGIPRSGMKRVWSYFYTSANSGTFDAFSDGADFSTNTPLAGLGYGLPLSRLYARYFGGDLQVIPMQGYGTDAYCFLKRVADATEPEPPMPAEARA